MERNYLTGDGVKKLVIMSKAFSIDNILCDISISGVAGSLALGREDDNFRKVNYEYKGAKTNEVNEDIESQLIRNIFDNDDHCCEGIIHHGDGNKSQQGLFNYSFDDYEATEQNHRDPLMKCKDDKDINGRNISKQASMWMHSNFSDNSNSYLQRTSNFS